jgi:DNA-binding NtrC family response regulator
MLKTLIIDDDKLIRWSLKEIFSDEGYTVDVAGSRAEAREHVGSRAYDIIFADFEMDNTQTTELIREIKRRQPDTALVIVSAAQRSKIEQALAGIDVFQIMEKPFQSDHIRDIARMVQDQHKSHSSSSTKGKGG